MNMLHICSYYIGNKLYSNLINEISKNNINQSVFIPIKNKNQYGINQLNDKKINVDYYYSKMIKKSDRFLYHKKIRKQAEYIEAEIVHKKKVSFIHAHTVFSDGGTALLMYKKFNISYLVTVRNTDINIFYKYAIHLRPFMYEILINAKKIVFISHAYKIKMIKLLPEDIIKQIKDKFIVLPNGIEDYWHENSKGLKELSLNKKLSLLFIGSIDKNKNLKTVLKVCEELNYRGFNVHLDVIGGGPLLSKYQKKVRNSTLSEYVKFHGFISKKDEIKSIMKKSDMFILPSLKETFGLVYVEAMSQGLPIIYTKGEGIDGFFDDGKVGYSVDPRDVCQIVNKIIDLTNNYEGTSNNSFNSSLYFRWHQIADEYLKIYN